MEHPGGDLQEAVSVSGVRGKVLTKSTDMRIINLIEDLDLDKRRRKLKWNPGDRPHSGAGEIRGAHEGQEEVTI